MENEPNLQIVNIGSVKELRKVESNKKKLKAIRKQLRKRLLTYLWKKYTQGTVYSVEEIVNGIMRIVREESKYIPEKWEDFEEK